MEGQRARVALIACLILATLVMESAAAFSFACHGKCFLPGRSKEDCSNTVEKRCKNKSMLAESSPSYLCQHGCTTNMCTKISTSENPAAAKISACVDDCGMMCAKH
ncbi:hypothetical protein CK203_033952 [Vitis vinifera]|uniref:Thionin-like protein 2 n=1 Tax=Vitis vinifera TaxID=29760 RepID=A0A438HTZ6_VITVI|nr:hypothetical protein CK203_033952 [Vitis vinifera]